MYACVASARYRACAVCCCGPVLALVSWLWIRSRQIRKATLDPVLVSWLWIRCRQIWKAALDPVLVSWLWIRCRQIRKAALDPVLVPWLRIKSLQIRKTSACSCSGTLDRNCAKGSNHFRFSLVKNFFKLFPLSTIGELFILGKSCKKGVDKSFWLEL